MDLNIEFSKIKEGQSEILRLLSQIRNIRSNKTELYSLDELSKLFKVTKRTIYNWKDKGLISCTIIGSKTYFTSKQLLEFLDNHEVKSIMKRGNHHE